jgi:hypothetical protein
MYRAGKLDTRIQKIYQGGFLIAVVSTRTNSLNFTTKAGSPYSLSFGFWPDHNLDAFLVYTNDDIVVDGFYCTNNVLSPANSSFIQGFHDATSRLKEIHQSKQSTNTPPTAPDQNRIE